MRWIQILGKTSLEIQSGLIKILIGTSIFMTGVCITSCDRIMPTAFWKEYKNHLIKEDISDQGPWGGHRSMFWESKTENEFKREAIIEFAKENGWLFTSAKTLAKADIRSWTYDREMIFPLDYEGLHVAEGSPVYADFPRWINDDLELLEFKTPWIIVKPGTDESRDAHGYIIINKNGNEMSVYHMWGE